VVRYLSPMTTSRDPSFAGYRHPGELISYAVWLYFRFPLSLRMIEGDDGHARHFGDLRDDPTMGPEVRPRIRQPDPSARTPPRRQVAPRRGCHHHRWPEALALARGRPGGLILDVLVQSRRDKKAAKRFQSRQRIRSTVSERRLPASQSSAAVSDQLLAAAWARCWVWAECL
jgi:putative transposase